jgi:hypothetical protein
MADPTYSSTVGNRESLKQDAELIAADITPVTGLLMHKNSGEGKNKRPRTLMDRLKTPANVPHIEGDDTNGGADKYADVREFEGQAQRTANPYSVSKEQEQENSAVVSNMVKAAQKTMTETAIDKELVLCGDQIRVQDVPGSVGGGTIGLGALIDNGAILGDTGIDPLYVTPAASIYSGTKALFTEAAFGAVIASMWTQSTAIQDLWLIAGTGLREFIIDQFTRTAGTASKVDYNVNGTTTIPWTVEVYDSYLGKVNIKNGNPNCMPSIDRGYLINPDLLYVEEYQGMESENYPFLGGSYKGAVDTRYALMTTGPNGLGKIAFSDEA